jgi:serine protease AprX
MKKILLLIIICVATGRYADAQTVYAYRVTFSNKNGSLTIADSLSFLSQKSLNRRSKQGITLDYFDLPVVQSYIDSVKLKSNAFRIKNKSKWFNQIVILTKTLNMANVVALPFVSEVKMVGKYANGWGFKSNNPLPAKNKNDFVVEEVSKKQRGDSAAYSYSYRQIKQTNTDYLHDLGFRGEGMDVAVIDMGFSKVYKLAAFDSVRLQNRFIDQYNFVRDTINIDSFTNNISHGTDALSMMATNMPGTYIGSAPNSNYGLYMSEDLYFESPIEEDNWVSAAERADSLGVDLINTSLGYFIFDADFSTDNYTYANDFDGKTTLIARGHNMAVSRGIFCVSAQGNMGGQPWKYLITPADADSTYSVGALDSSGAFLSSMGSSFGPSSDGQVKPDGLGCGVRVMLISNATGLPAISGGTSFSAPLIAGGITCLMQALPTLPIWEIRKLVQQSSSRYTTPSDTMGYGVPNFKIALETGKVLGLQNIKMGNANDYILYPNPSIGSNMYINYTKGNLYNSSIEIINIQGQIVSKQLISNNRFTISDLKKGIYYARISNKNELIVKCILID